MQLNMPSMQVEFSPTPFKTTTKLRFFVMQKNRYSAVILLFYIPYCNIEFHFIKQKK